MYCLPPSVVSFVSVELTLVSRKLLIVVLTPGSLCVDGVCRTECDFTAPDADDFCASFDGQLPVCGPDNLCYAPSEVESDCRTQDDCAEGESCIDGQCR